VALYTITLSLLTIIFDPLGEYNTRRKKIKQELKKGQTMPRKFKIYKDRYVDIY
jgi:hypothetical protein